MANIQNVVATLVVPNQPKSLPNQQIFVYTNKSDILNIISGDTIVGAAHKDDQGYNIADRFTNIIDGTIKVGAAQNADHADTADNATNATNATNAITASKAINDGNNENIADHFVTVGTKANDAYLLADEANTRSVANADKISEIEQELATGENYIGTMTINSDVVPLPTPTADLNQFVWDNTFPHRSPKQSDLVIVVQVITNSPDKAYRYRFNGTVWSGYEIPPAPLAQNGEAGIVSGTYGIKNYNTLVSISGGEIIAIYIKGLDGNYHDLRTYSTTIEGLVSDILSGTRPAAKATDATNDGSGNNIVDTYMTKTAGATKGYVQDYALPKEFNNVLYMTASGYSEEIPTTPASGIQFTATAGLGETLVGTCEYELVDLKMQLSRKNSYSARLFIRFDAVGLQDPSNTYRYKILTYLQKAGQTRTLLSSELLPETAAALDEGYIRAVDFGTNFDELGDAVFDLENGDKIIQEYYFVQSSSFSMTVDIFSNSVYPSRMNLNTSTTTIVYRETEVGETIYISPDIADITRDAETGAILISVDNDELSRLSSYPIPSNIVIHLPDLSGIAGISPSDIIIGISSTTPNYFFAIKGTNNFITVEDLVPYRKTNGQYFVSGVVVDQGTIQLIAPNIMSIRGTITILPSDWYNAGYYIATKTIPNLEDNDDIFFTPNAEDNIPEIVEQNEAGVLPVVNRDGSDIYFMAKIAPETNIELNYTIRKN